MIELATLHELDAVEWFLGRALTEAGIWPGPRASDGLAAGCHWVERTDERVSVRGEVWEIADQSRRWFWISIERSGAWTLGFDVEPRKAKYAGAAEAMEDVEWLHLLDGDAVMRNGAATPIAARYRDV